MQQEINSQEVNNHETTLSSHIKTYSIIFKDKGRFLTALITPIVLIILYMTFLGTVYHDSLDSIVKYYSVSQRLLMLL